MRECHIVNDCSSCLYIVGLELFFNVLITLFQLHTLVVDKLIRMQIIDSMAVVNWLFTPEVMPQFTR